MKKILLIFMCILITIGFISCGHEETKQVYVYNINIERDDADTSTYQEDNLIIVNTRTGVYHQFGCIHADNIDLDNKDYMDESEAITEGYRECKICIKNN
jgi:uncharacterized lipoprotein YehR (DUF1307 family)